MLLSAAIVLFILSFIFNTIYTYTSSINVERRNAEKYLYGLQKDFDRFLADTSLLIKLVEDKESESQFNYVIGKRYGIYLYTNLQYKWIDLYLDAGCSIRHQQCRNNNTPVHQSK